VIGFDLERPGLTAGDVTLRPVGVLRAVTDDDPADDPTARPIDRTVATVGKEVRWSPGPTGGPG
jgi:hypothetical protein